MKWARCPGPFMLDLGRLRDAEAKNLPQLPERSTPQLFGRVAAMDQIADDFAAANQQTEHQDDTPDDI